MRPLPQRPASLERPRLSVLDGRVRAAPMRPDEQLMVAVQGGERAAYQELYERWAKRVLRFLLRRLGALPAAEDALQETWLRVYRYRETYRSERTFATWLFAIAANVGKRSYTPQPETFEWEPRAEDHPHLRDLLVRALHGLDEDDARVFLLTVEGFNSTEIGEMLDLGPGTIRMRLKRARDRLRDSLGALDG